LSKTWPSVVFLSLLGAPCFAAPPETPEPSAVVQQLLRETAAGETVELSGYVGPSAPDVVRLYGSLALGDYVEVPRAALVSVLDDAGPKDGPVRLLVRANATVVSARRHPARETSFGRRALAPGLVHPAGDGIRDDNTCALTCVFCGLTSSTGACTGCVTCVLM